MSVHAGAIIHAAGRNVLDRLQSAGLGDARVNVDTIREVGNELVVDKVPTEPDFTFSLESWDTSTEIEALLVGKAGGAVGDPAQAPGAADAAGTEYKWEDCKFLNVISPWKDPDSGAAGDIEAGVIIPGFYPTRVRYRFGVTDNATQEVELAGGSYYYGEFAPVEEFAVGDAIQTDFVTAENTIHYRKGGAGGTTFKDVFGVIVAGDLKIEGVDYTVTGGDGAPATIEFVVAPAVGEQVRYAYFTDEPQAYPQAVHPDSVVKPGAVRGRNIQVMLDPVGAGALKRIPGVQTVEVEATTESTVERELGSEDIVGRTINGRDCSATLTIRHSDKDAFFQFMTDVTGVPRDEVFGYFNQSQVDLQIRIENPKNPGQILKTLRLKKAQFQPPGTPARVNQPTDFQWRADAVDGTYSAYKGVPA